MRAIFHADKNWGIGKGNGLLFSLPKDMKFFRETTTGKTVVMGKNTFLSLPSGPLKNRRNLVLTHQKLEGVETVSSFTELFEKIKDLPPEDVFLIGGASLYRELLPYCTEVLVTKVDAASDADAFVPNLDRDESFRLIFESGPLEDNGYLIKFCTYQNLKVQEPLK